LFCGTCGIPLQEKKSDSSVIYDLFNFHVESGNEIIKNHFLTNYLLRQKSIVNDLGITITCPRIIGKYYHRNNYSYETPKDYYRVSVFVPYLESIIQTISEELKI